MPRRILHVLSNVARYDDPAEPCGLWLPELSHAWEVFARRGYAQHLVSPPGGHSPLEPRSLKWPNRDATAKSWLADAARMALLSNTVAPDAVDAQDFDAIYFTGGHAVIIDRLKAGKTPLAPVRDDRLRTLIWTPDVYGQTWNLPCDDERPSYKQLIFWASQSFGRSCRFSPHHLLPRWTLSAAGLISKPVAELRALLPRYAHDNLFDSSKFKQAFPGFSITRYRRGLALIANEFQQNQQQPLTQPAKAAIK